MTNQKGKDTILVTGGAGYVGSTLVGDLLRNGYKVIVLDSLSFGAESLLGYTHHPSFHLINGDITRPADVRGAFEGRTIDAVIHLAAIVGDPACAMQSKLAHQINWEGSCLVLEETLKNKTPRFIFASTCSNYGKMEDPKGFVNETSKLSPVSLYAELKVKVEQVLLKELKQESNFIPTVLRFATVYGLSPRMRFDLTVNEFVREIALGRELQVFGEQFWRPYCHVYDFARAMQVVLNAPEEKVAYNVFNVGDTQENYQKKMIVDEILKVMPQGRVKYVFKTEDPRDYRVSFEKINKELGFFVSRKVPDGIKEIKQFIESNAFINPDDPKFSNIANVRKNDTLIRT